MSFLLKKYNRKILGWALYDWANSAFATTVMAGFFPLFFKSYWNHQVDPVVSSARLGTTISLASLLIALTSPFLGYIADHISSKKIFTFSFMVLGVISCGLLFWVPEGAWVWASVLYGMAMVGFASSCIYYDSLLSTVAKDSQLHGVSALGYSLGYLGGGLLFLINVLMYLNPEKFGLESSIVAIKVSFLTVSLWWFVFAIPLFVFVNEPVSNPLNTLKLEQTLKLSAQALKKTFLEVRLNSSLLYFILAYWFFIDGVYTVITMALDFGIGIGLDKSALIKALLITQFVGFPATLIYGPLSRKWGALRVLKGLLLAYLVIIFLGSQMTSSVHFYALAVMVGLFQGGVQSLSRSQFAQMVPRDSSARYFAFFDIIGKFASILGPLVVGWTAYVTHSSRLGILGLAFLLGIGLFLLNKVSDEGRPTVEL